MHDLDYFLGLGWVIMLIIIVYTVRWGVSAKNAILVRHERRQGVLLHTDDVISAIWVSAAGATVITGMLGMIIGSALNAVHTVSISISLAASVIIEIALIIRYRRKIGSLRSIERESA